MNIKPNGSNLHKPSSIIEHIHLPILCIAMQEGKKKSELTSEGKRTVFDVKKLPASGCSGSRESIIGENKSFGFFAPAHLSFGQVSIFWVNRLPIVSPLNYPFTILKIGSFYTWKQPGTSRRVDLRQDASRCPVFMNFGVVYFTGAIDGCAESRIGECIWLSDYGFKLRKISAVPRLLVSKGFPKPSKPEIDFSGSGLPCSLIRTR